MFWNLTEVERTHTHAHLCSLIRKRIERLGKTHLRIIVVKFCFCFFVPLAPNWRDWILFSQVCWISLSYFLCQFDLNSCRILHYRGHQSVELTTTTTTTGKGKKAFKKRLHDFFFVWWMKILHPLVKNARSYVPILHFFLFTFFNFESLIHRGTKAIWLISFPLAFFDPMKKKSGLLLVRIILFGITVQSEAELLLFFWGERRRFGEGFQCQNGLASIFRLNLIYFPSFFYSIPIFFILFRSFFVAVIFLLS